MRLLSIGAVFFSFAVFGGEGIDFGVFKVLNEANQQKLLKESSLLCLPLASSSNKDDKKNQQNEMNDCVVALCGMPENNPTIYITDKNFAKYLTPEIRAQLPSLLPKLKKIIKKENASEVSRLNEIRHMLKNPNPEKWKTEFRAEMSHKMFAPFMIETVDLKKPIEDRFNISLKVDQNIDPEFKKALIDYRDKYKRFVISDADSFLEKGLYSEVELRKIGKERLDQLKVIYDKTTPKMSKFDKEDIASRIASSLEDLKAATGEDLSVAMINISNLEDQVGTFLPEQGIKPPKPLCESHNDFCDKSFKNFILNSGLISSVDLSLKRINEPESFKRKLNYCQAKIVAKLSVSTEQRKAQLLVEQVKKELNKNVFSRFSAHSRKILQDYFKNKIAVHGASLDSKLGKTKPADNFKKNINQNLKDVYEPFPMDEEYAITSALSMAEGDQEESQGFCSPAFVSNAYDAYLSSESIKQLPESKKLFKKISPNDNLFISPFSCQHEIRGRSNVAHELGHAINHVFNTVKLSESSSRQFKDLRKCSTENYIEFIPYVGWGAHEGDALHTEEDSADVFAYMTYSNNNDLFSCELLRPALDNQSYDNLSLIEDKSETHSTPFYRLIMEAINKNKVLPISCQRSIEPFKEKLRLKKCVL